MKMKEFKCKLQEYYNFSEEDWALTEAAFLPEKLAAKNYFLKKDKVSDRIAYVLSGMLRSFFYNDQADEITTHFFKPKNVVISIESFNMQVPSLEFIVAVEDCELLVVSYDRMQDLMQRIPAWQQIVKNTDQYKYRQQMKRAIQFQTLSASERYMWLLEKHPDIVQKVALKHIASYLGIDIATLSRLRKRI